VNDESAFDAALAIPGPAERAAFLDRACADNPALRREVEGLLAAHAADNPLDRPPADLGRTGAYEPRPHEEAPGAAVGDRVGPYRLMEQIGEGGFGLVFVAEQAEPVRRKVALKVLKPGMDTRYVVARFEAERQALALMDHPNIAKVFDAGSTPAGRPYFVMELVRGVPITDFCDQHKLPPRQRLALFVQVCQAVQHAHQKGVIHRDLKPSNVLVTVIDGAPVPKVIDFGVAKAVGQSLTEKTIYTRFAQMIGTPLYMSPEQAELSGTDVDTRADVYALGVLLYELLTGTTPFDRDRFRKAAFDEIRRIIREEEPPRPSTRLTSLGATLTTVSASRGTDPGKLAGLVRGELDWIVMRCLEKDRGRRYETATGLARDIERYLAGEAVEACPPTPGYRLRKLVRRNRTAIAVALLFGVSLTTASLVSVWQMSRARKAERDAARQRDDALAAQRAAAGERDNVARANEALNRLSARQRLALYDNAMTLAQAAWEGGNPARTFELLRQWAPKPGEDDPRGFEWHYWDRLAHQDIRTVRLAGFAGVDAELSPPVLSPDGTRVAAFVADRDGQAARLKLWDAGTGQEVWGVAAPGGESPAGYAGFSGDGRRFTAARFTAPRGEGGARRRYEVWVWDAETGKAVYSTRAPERSTTGKPALSPDGSRLAVLTAVREGAPVAMALSVVGLPDGKEVFRYPPQPSHEFVWLAAFSPDGARLAALVMDPAAKITLHVWELNGGRDVWRAPLPDGVGPMDLRFSPGGARIAARVGDEQTDQVLLWAVGGGEKPQAFRVPGPPGWRLAQPPVTFAPDGRLAVPQGTQVYLFDTGAEGTADPRPVRGHDRAVRAAAFAPGGSRLVTLDAGGSVKQWDVSGRRPRLKTPFGSLVTRGTVFPNPDGSRVSFVPSPGDPARRFRLTDGAGRVVGESTLPPPPSHPDFDAFSADGRTYALLWHDGYNYTLFVWDAAAGKEVRRLTPPPNSRGAVALSPDGSRVAVTTTSAPNEGGWSLSTLNVWETATGREVLARDGIRSEDVFHAAYSTDGRWLMINPGLAADGDERLVWLDARTGAEAATLRLGSRVLTGGALSRDGRRLALAHRAGETTTVEAWDVEAVLRGEAPEPIALLTAAGSNFLGIDFNPDGRRVLTWGDGGVKLWDVASGREVLALRADGAALGAARFSPDGHTIWGGLDEDGRLWGWDATPVAEGKAP
jgi:serine/threonine protein kinase/WD40 repeat protein